MHCRHFAVFTYRKTVLIPLVPFSRVSGVGCCRECTSTCEAETCGLLDKDEGAYRKHHNMQQSVLHQPFLDTNEILS